MSDTSVDAMKCPNCSGSYSTGTNECPHCTWPVGAVQEGDGKPTCYDCGRLYGNEHGFPDLVVPNDVWSVISPTGDEGGLLCPSCICKRLHEHGFENVAAVFRSGPCFAPPAPERQPEIEIKMSALIHRHDEKPMDAVEIDKLLVALTEMAGDVAGADSEYFVAVRTELATQDGLRLTCKHCGAETPLSELAERPGAPEPQREPVAWASWYQGKQFSLNWNEPTFDRTELEVQPLYTEARPVVTEEIETDHDPES